MRDEFTLRSRLPLGTTARKQIRKILTSNKMEPGPSRLSFAPSCFNIEEPVPDKQEIGENQKNSKSPKFSSGKVRSASSTSETGKEGKKVSTEMISQSYPKNPKIPKIEYPNTNVANQEASSSNTSLGVTKKRLKRVDRGKSRKGASKKSGLGFPERYLTRFQMRKLLNSKVQPRWVKTGWEKWFKKLKYLVAQQNRTEKKEKFVPTFKASKISSKLEKLALQEKKKKTPTIIGPNSIIVNRALAKIKIESDYIPLEMIKTENEVEPPINSEDEIELSANAEEEPKSSANAEEETKSSANAEEEPESSEKSEDEEMPELHDPWRDFRKNSVPFNDDGTLESVQSASENSEDEEMPELHDTRNDIPENSVSLNDDGTLESVQNVNEEVTKALEVKIQELGGILKTTLIKLDNIKTDGKAAAQKAKLDVIKQICDSIEALDAMNPRRPIMNIISFFFSDSISPEIVAKILRRTGKVSIAADHENICESIQKHPMLNYSGGKVSVHPLVQEVTRNELKKRGEFPLILFGIARSMSNLLVADEIALEDLVHAKSVWQHVTKEKKCMLEANTGLPVLICEELFGSEKYQDLFEFSCESGDLMESVLGQNNRLTLKLKFWKGSALNEVGKLSESLEVLKNVCEKQKEIFGEEDADYLDSAHGVGIQYEHLKNYEEAMKTFKNTLEVSERIFGNEDKRTLTLKNDIANALHKQNNFDAALKLYEDVFSVAEQVFGKENSLTLSTKFKLADVKLAKKDYPAALKDFQEVLEIRERVLGPNHPHTSGTKCRVATTYIPLGKHKESLQLLKDIHKSQVQVFGSRNPEAMHLEYLMQHLQQSVLQVNPKFQF